MRCWPATAGAVPTTGVAHVTRDDACSPPAGPQVSVAALTRGGLQVLCHAWDRDLGGRGLDDLIFEAVADDFKVGARGGAARVQGVRGGWGLGDVSL